MDPMPTGDPPAMEPQPTPESLGLDPKDAYGPLDKALPVGARVVTIGEFKTQLAKGKPEFVSELGTQAAHDADAAQKQNDEQTLAAYVMANPDPAIQAMFDATPSYDAQTRVRTDGNVDVDLAFSGKTTPSPVILMGKANRRHRYAEVIRTGHARPNREALYKTLYDAMPLNVGNGLPNSSSLGGLSDAELDDALIQLGGVLSDMVSYASPAQPSIQHDDNCWNQAGTGEISGEIQGAFDPNGVSYIWLINNSFYSLGGLWAKMTWPHKKDTTCVRDQGRRGTNSAFAFTSAAEQQIAIQTGKHYDLSEQAIYAQYKRAKGEWDFDGVWADELSMHLAVVGYQAPYEGSWRYNKSPKLAPAMGHPFKDACLGYLGDCTETSHQSPVVCTSVHFQVYCLWQERNDIPENPLVSLPSTSDHLRVMTNVTTRKNAIDLAIGALTWTDRSVIMTFTVGDAFANAGSDGFVASTFAGDHGLNSAHVVAYIPNAKLSGGISPAAGGGYFVVKSSFGRSHGDQGYYYVPSASMQYYVVDVVAL
jgi:hypothetical protein